MREPQCPAFSEIRIDSSPRSCRNQKDRQPDRVSFFAQTRCAAGAYAPK